MDGPPDPSLTKIIRNSIANAGALRQIENMRPSQVPFELLRGVLLVLGIFFAHFLGRSIARVRRGDQRLSGVYAWALRTLVAGAAVAWPYGLDATTLGAWTLALAALAAGIWVGTRPRRAPDDPSKEIFPE